MRVQRGATLTHIGVESKNSGIVFTEFLKILKKAFGNINLKKNSNFEVGMNI